LHPLEFQLCYSSVLAVDSRVSSQLGDVLLGDIGATNARLALLANGVLGPIKGFEVANFSRFADVVEVFLNDCFPQAEIRLAFLAVAGPVADNSCTLTNCSWTIDAKQLLKTFGLEARLVNDFEATALSLSSLKDADLAKLGGGHTVAR